MSKIKVNSIEAATGSTITIPSGQTLDISSTTLTLPSTVVTTTGTQTLTNKTIGVSQLSGTLPVANGGTGLTTLGTAEQVLRVNSGATALEFGTVSSDFVKLSSTTTASAASVSFDGFFTADYDNYVIYVNTYNNATGNQYPQVRFRRSNSDVTTSNYRFASGRLMRNVSNSDVNSGENGWDQSYIRLNQDSDNNAATAHSYIIQIPNPLDTAVYPGIIFDGISTNNGNGDYYRRYGFGRLATTGALSGISFFSSSGNIKGTFKLYGIKA
jgi:hypothetical protein